MRPPWVTATRTCLTTSGACLRMHPSWWGDSHEATTQLAFELFLLLSLWSLCGLFYDY